MAQYLIDLFLTDRLIGSAVQDDAVLTLADLDDRMACRLAVVFQQIIGLDIVSVEIVDEVLSVTSDLARMIDIQTGLGQRDRRIQALAAEVADIGKRRLRFLGLSKMVHLIDMVVVERTEVQDFHLILPRQLPERS